MRIAVSNPDNIGDFILRQPMLAAVMEAGHEVLLIVRDFVAPLAADLFPQARVLRCIGNPYGRDFSLATGLGREMLREVKEFAPDLFVVAPFQYTQLEEQVAAGLPGVDCIGLSGYLYQARPETTVISAIRFATRVSVAKESAELHKNELLCAAVLGRHVKLDRPRMEARPQALAGAAARLRELGLDGRPFWAVCAGNAPDKEVRNWRMEQWAEFCRGLVEETGATLVFIGSPDEHAGTVEIQSAMGESGLRTAAITGEPMKLDTLAGILQLSEGYIGKDTGPMHIAAALGKPVLAVFGGGDWPRFVPAARSGGVFTVSVPCTGCGWDCHLSRSHCVKDVPVVAVLAKAAAMVRGGATEFSVEVLQPDRVMEAAILRELLASVRTDQRNVAAERANFLQWHDDRTREIAGLRGELDAVRSAAEARELRLQQLLAVEERAAALEFESRLAMSNVRQATEARSAAERRVDRFRRLAVRKIAEGRARAEALRSANSALEIAAAGQLESLRERLEEKTLLAATLQTRVDTADSRNQGMLADREQLLKRKSAELVSALELIPDLREELAALAADLAARERSVETLVKEVDDTNRDRAAKQELIDSLLRRIEVIEDDREERLRLIERLSEQLATVEADRAARGEQIAALHEHAANLQADLAGLRNLLPYRIMKQLHIL